MNLAAILGSLLGVLALMAVFNSLRLRTSRPVSNLDGLAPARRSLKCCDLNKSELNVFGRR
ncbi:MAG: hypothetical protein ACYSRP_00935 [Planctomycetota bacterium]|jgi:hypothetical protein